jgi:hypothetical protein
MFIIFATCKFFFYKPFFVRSQDTHVYGINISFSHGAKLILNSVGGHNTLSDQFLILIMIFFSWKS